MACWWRLSKWTRRWEPSGGSRNRTLACSISWSRTAICRSWRAWRDAARGAISTREAGDRQGRIYNVNADQMAVACAAAFGAQQLVFLTDVEGVMDGDRRVRASLTVAESRGLIESGIATGGMLAKLNAAMAALTVGVGQVRIAAGAADRVVERLLAGEEIGTRMVTGEAQAA